MSWRDDLQPASWRGIPFKTVLSTIKAGRNLAPHAYPYREDKVIWLEDLGLGARRMQFLGYLLGDDVAQQQLAMLAAVETAGVGELVHPQLGSTTGKVVDFAAITRADKGGAIELAIEFIAMAEDAAPYPAAPADTQAAVKNAVDDTRETVGERLRAKAAASSVTRAPAGTGSSLTPAANL